MGLCKIQVIGNLGADAIINQVSGKTVINFSLAYTERWKDAQGQDKSRTEWFSCAYWSERTTVAQYMKKGDQIYIEGQPSVKMYKDNRGDMIPQMTVRVNHIQLLGGSKEQKPQQQYENANEITEPLSDLPF